MSLVHFVKMSGKDLSGKGIAPTAAALKRDLDSYNLGTEKIRLQIQGETVLLRGAVASRDNGITHQGRLAYYVVKPGDNLAKIAEKLYGPSLSMKGGTIFEANRPMLKVPNKIYPGQLLRIPILPGI